MKTIEYEFFKKDSLRQRAQKIAEIALADMFDNHTKVHVMLPKAVLRVMEVLEIYEGLDKSE